MNDRFKFRAWIAKYKKLVDVFKYGNDLGTCEWIWHSHIYDTPDGKPVLDNWESVDERFSNIIERTKLIDCVLEQCTGLKDKNGKLIYENDLIKCPNGIYRIAVDDFGLWTAIYENNPLKGVVEWSDIVKNYAFNLENVEIEVLGNIHTENINDM